MRVLLTLRRLFERLAGALAWAVLLGLLGLGVAVYLAVQGLNLDVVRYAARFVGQLTAGQRVERLQLDVSVQPVATELAVRAVLRVGATAAERRRLYFLLNDGLRIRRCERRLTSGARVAVRTFQVSAMTVMVLDPPLAAGENAEIELDYSGKIDLARFGEAGDRSGKEIVLGPEAFWYPLDGQSFFDAEISVTTPRSFIVAYNGVPDEEAEFGLLRRVRWHSERPVSGLSLIAGDYRLDEREVDGVTLRLFQAADVRLDAERVLDQMQRARAGLTERLGPSGFSRSTIFATRAIRRGFNDGTGLIGLSIRYFRQADRGFGLVAHEIAHDWWGGTVAGHWLSGQPGGQWIVEGMAELSSMLISEAEFGAEALSQRLRWNFFDPQRQGTVSAMTVLDNLLNEDVARDTIYRKGSYVGAMLRRQLGDEALFAGLRRFLEKHRYSHATDADLQAALEGDQPGSLDEFFADWVRSPKRLDLSLETKGPGELTVSNLGSAAAPVAIDLLTLPQGGGEAEHRTVAVGDVIAIPAGAELLLDAALGLADVVRENNRYPRHEDPLALAISARGATAIAYGSPQPWERSTVELTAHGEQPGHTWSLERGIVQVPQWDPKGEALVASVSDPDSRWPAVVLLEGTGERRKLGHGSSPALAADGNVYAGRGDKLMRLSRQGPESVVVQRRKRSVEQVWPAPDGKHLAYISAAGNSIELRLRNDSDDRVLFGWDRDRTVCRWAPDSTRMYCLIGGNADWQIWEVPASGEAIRIVARDAAAIGDLALSPNGEYLAFTAAEPDEPTRLRRELYIVNLASTEVTKHEAPEYDLSQLVWRNDDQLAVIAAEWPAMSFPARRVVLEVSRQGGVESSAQ